MSDTPIASASGNVIDSRPPPVVNAPPTTSSRLTGNSMGSNDAPATTTIQTGRDYSNIALSPDLTMVDTHQSLPAVTAHTGHPASTSTAALDHTAVSHYLPLVVGDGIASAEQLLRWKRICTDALAARSFSGLSVSIQGRNIEAVANCLSQYLIHLHTPGATTSFVPPPDTTCATAPLQSFLHESRVYRV